MSKRKKSKKRNRNRRSGSFNTVAETVVPDSTEPVAAPLAMAPPKIKPTVQIDDRWSYVSNDVKRVGLLAVFFTLFQIALWYLMGHTGLGTIVYSLIKT